MFNLRVTIEVVNDVGNVVDHRGYAVRPGNRGITLTSTQSLFGEGGKPMGLASAHNRLNTLHAAVKSIGETLNG